MTSEAPSREPIEPSQDAKPDGAGVVAVALLAVVVATAAALGDAGRRRMAAELAAIATDWERLPAGGALALAARRILRPALKRLSG